jgi:hypothetical protein
VDRDEPGLNYPANLVPNDYSPYGRDLGLPCMMQCPTLCAAFSAIASSPLNDSSTVATFATHMHGCSTCLRVIRNQVDTIPKFGSLLSAEDGGSHSGTVSQWGHRSDSIITEWDSAPDQAAEILDIFPNISMPSTGSVGIQNILQQQPNHHAVIQLSLPASLQRAQHATLSPISLASDVGQDRHVHAHMHHDTPDNGYSTHLLPDGY